MKLSSVLALAGLTGTAFGQAKIKFMPLGDSITELQCWRSMVWDNLVAAGLSSKVDFVGSMNSNPGPCRPKDSNYDRNHEGHSGWKAIDIANNNLPGWLNSSKPDIINIMLGTNDLNSGTKSPADVLAAFTKMVGQIRSSNPKTKIIVDKIIPITNSNDSKFTQFNSQLVAWAQGLNNTDSPINVIDCSRTAGFTNQMLRDGIHPTYDTGDSLIAKAVTPVLINYLRILTNTTA